MTVPDWPHVPTRRRSRLHTVFGALVVLGTVTLWLQMTPFMQSLSMTKGQHPVASNTSHVTPLFGNGAAGDDGGKNVLDEDLLHLSLLHEHCVRDASVSLPWTFGSPGNQLPNASASNPEVVMHLKDENLLAKLRQCPDVDIFLPLGLHGDGYCEDAVAYVKCESLREAVLGWYERCRLTFCCRCFRSTVSTVAAVGAPSQAL